MMMMMMMMTTMTTIKVIERMTVVMVNCRGIQFADQVWTKCRRSRHQAWGGPNLGPLPAWSPLGLHLVSPGPPGLHPPIGLHFPCTSNTQKCTSNMQKRVKNPIRKMHLHFHANRMNPIRKLNLTVGFQADMNVHDCIASHMKHARCAHNSA